MENFHTGEGPNENSNGTISYEGYGIGAIFIPAGLGYFDQSTSNIPSYSPLVFKVDALILLKMPIRVPIKMWDTI